MNLNPFYSNPADSGMSYLNQIPGEITPYFQPYIDSGNQSLNTLMSQYNTMVTNPQAIMQMAGSGFQEDPGYQYDYNQGMNGANAAAASGGMLGTPDHQNQAAATSENLANQQYQQYLNHVLGLYSQGISGYQGINQMGYNASDSLASMLAANSTNQAGMAYKGQANQNQANGDMINMGVGLVSSLF